MIRPHRVRDIMARSPRTATPGTTLAEAYELLVEGGFRHLPVLDDSGRLAGMISDRDLLAAMPPPGASAALVQAAGAFSRRTVADVMAQAVLAVSEDESLEVAIELLIANRVSALAVTGPGERLTGIVTLVDVAGAFINVLKTLPRRV
jgi:acetoin utilization protein AcuB